MSKLIKARCFAWRIAGNSAMLLAFPLYALDASFSWIAKAVTVLCALAASPLVIFYDWCVKRHNAIRRAATGGPDVR